MKEINLNIKGPFSLFGNSDFDYFFNSPFIKDKGIYLWTVPYNNSELVYYVGETGRNFEIRMTEHIQNYLSGEYGINEPEQLKKGKRVRIWEGTWRGEKVENFLSKYEEFIPKIFELLKLYRFYLIPMNFETNLRKRIEGELCKHLFDQGGIIGNFQESDFRYTLPKIDSEPIKVMIECNSKILGLPEEF